MSWTSQSGHRRFFSVVTTPTMMTAYIYMCVLPSISIVFDDAIYNKTGCNFQDADLARRWTGWVKHKKNSEDKNNRSNVLSPSYDPS